MIVVFIPSALLLTEKDKRLRVKIREVPAGRDSGETRSCSDGQGLLSNI